MTPVILSGGSGTRLWPISRESYPKQFCEFFDRSFLVNTWERVAPFGDPMVVTLESMGALTRKSLQPLGLHEDNLLLEPLAKNTAGAVALLCHVLMARGKTGEIVGVFPADHLIANTDRFQNAVRLAERVAANGYLVTLGIEPRSPATGFGYIQVREQEIASDASAGVSAMAVEGFREKPDLTLARQFFQSGTHFWNAGIFVFRVSDMAAAFEKFLPEIWRKVQTLEPDLSNLKYVYANLDSISLDHGIAEKMRNLACVPVDIGWSDVGSWDEVSRLSEENPVPLESKGRVFQAKAVNNFVFSQGQKVIGLAGVQNLIVVESPDALLITQKGHSETVKDLVKVMRDAGLPQAQEHPFESRPWGRFESLYEEPLFKVKKIEVEPGQQLSYQSHTKRAETWLVVSGRAEVVLDGETLQREAGQVIQIPRESKHRMRNNGTELLVFVEIQTGSYFGEDDIVRYSDDYGRT